ncbi:MAG: hypothetical protein WDO24_04980 [Pseudomonadota bacterium]
MLSGSRVGLLGPAVVALAVLLGAPLLLVADESLRVFVPGHVGAARDAPLTAQHYLDLASPAYLHYFADTFRIGLIAALLGLVVAYPIAYRVARESRSGPRRLWIGFLVAHAVPQHSGAGLRRCADLRAGRLRAQHLGVSRRGAEQPATMPRRR